MRARSFIAEHASTSARKFEPIFHTVLVALALLLSGAGLAAAQTPVPALLRDDVAPHVRRGETAAALAALSALGDDSTPVARYVRARLHERVGDLAAAVRDYARVGPRDVPASAYLDARSRMLRGLARVGRCADFLTLQASESVGGTRGAIIDALAAECRHREALALPHEPAELRHQALLGAIEALRIQAERDAAEVDTFALRWMLAEALFAIGRVDEARAELRWLWIHRPAHPDAEQVVEALGAEFSPEVEARFARAQSLMRARRFGAAADLLGDRGGVNAETLPRWSAKHARALFRARRYPEAARAHREAARLDRGRAHEHRYQEARALARAARNDDAIARLDRLARGRHARVGAARFLAAWLALQSGRADAERRMERVLGTASSGPERQRKAAWALALNAFESRRYRDASRWFAQARESPRERRIRYWLARCDEERGRVSAARRSYRALHRESPLEWYGLMSARQLRARGETVSPGPGPGPASGAPPALPAEVRFYHELGLRQDAREALRRHEPELRRSAGSEAAEQLARLYASIGAPERARRLAPRRLWSSSAPRWVWDAAFPRPFPTALTRAVEEAAGGADADVARPSFLWATMRQESGYDVDAVSRVGAIGLLQLMPRSAERIARGAGLEIQTEQLFDPSWNLRLAARFIHNLHRDFDDNPILVMAAYNAGGVRVRSWRAARPDMALDLWVERIPFDETRRYVRRVSRHLARYEWIEGRAWFPPDL